MNSKIKLFIFDIGKVLIDFDFLPAIQKLRKMIRLDMLQVAKLFNNSDIAERWDKGLLTGKSFYEEIRREIDIPLKMSQFVEIWNDIFTPKEDMIALAQSLNKKYRVVLLSNTNPWHAAHIRKKYPWIKKFNAFIASCDVQMLKPDPKLFKLALKTGKAPPQEAFYVDDRTDFIKAAKGLGIDAVPFKSYSKLVEELQIREILPR